MFTRVFTIKHFLWKKNIVIHYGEGTLSDYLFFRDYSEQKGTEKWFFEFLISIRPETTDTEFFKIISSKNFSIILDDIIKTRFEGMFKKSLESNEEENDEEKKELKPHEIVEMHFKFRNFIAWFSEKNHISFKECINTHTATEFFEIAENYIFNANEGSEKGEEMNLKKLKLMKIAEMEKFNML